ncbi:unnamed protein product [Echinostoma caproni]|uniref:Secreted protein n=1 Tax=Echinostoma caproni TaxID=27848 RepID=A0A183AKX7_9TREM|nr:unnamed protein product [Echinostoma caproni]
MKFNGKMLVAVWFALITIQSLDQVSGYSACRSGCPDVFDHFLSGVYRWISPFDLCRPETPRPTQAPTTPPVTATSTVPTTTTTTTTPVTTTVPVPQIVAQLEATPEVKTWLLNLMLDSLCNIPNNLFAVYINSVLSSNRYSAQIVRIDPYDYIVWNATVQSSPSAPEFIPATIYLIFGVNELPIVENSTILDLSTLPACSTFIPLNDLQSTIEIVYAQWVNVIDQAGENATEPILCRRLESLMYLFRIGSVL